MPLHGNIGTNSMLTNICSVQRVLERPRYERPQINLIVTKQMCKTFHQLL